MDLKKPLSFTDQIQKLKSHGVVIADEDEAVRILKTVNYYRLTGYALQFRKDPKYSTYLEGTTFESIYHLYLVDERLRDLFRMYIEKAEIYYRTQIAYGFASVKCTEPLYDQHYDCNNFFNKNINLCLHFVLK